MFSVIKPCARWFNKRLREVYILVLLKHGVKCIFGETESENIIEWWVLSFLHIIIMFVEK